MGVLLWTIGRRDAASDCSAGDYGMGAMASAIPGARLMVVPNAGHLVPMEQPETTTRILGEFLLHLKPTS
jgi:pimeloyl-ACP methyl ester carboxylesterase